MAFVGEAIFGITARDHERALRDKPELLDPEERSRRDEPLAPFEDEEVSDEDDIDPLDL